MHKTRVGVLMGGKSIEREVSFNSGRTICDHLDTSAYDIIPIFQTRSGKLHILPWRFLYRGKIADFEHRLDHEAPHISWDHLKKIVDFIYLTMHGAFAEDGILQGTLEVLQIPYLGPKVLASALSIDKNAQKKFLKSAGISVPASLFISKNNISIITSQELIEQMDKLGINFPCIIKPCLEGSSLGISIVFEDTELLDAIKKASTVDPERLQDVLIEKKIEGMEFSCVILKSPSGQPLLLPPTEIVPEPNTHIFDYEQKYMPGRSIKFTPARCSLELREKIVETCLKTMQALDLPIARIDGFLTTDNEVIIIDTNPIPGMSPSSFLFRQAAECNLNHTQVINTLIESELCHYGILQNSNESKESNNTMNQTPKIKVGVLFGGQSNEKEISLESGRNVLYKLSPEKYEGIPLYVSSNLELFYVNQETLVRNSTKEIEDDLSLAKPIGWNQLPELVDFIFIGLHGGQGENGSVQGMLEMLNIPYNGSSVLTSALCMNKFKTNELLRSQGFHVPQSKLIAANQWFTHKKEILETLKNNFTFPCIVKPHDDGCSVMVSKIFSEGDLEQLCTDVFSKTNKTHLLIEEFIQGMELTVGVIGNNNPQALPPSQAIAGAGILSIQEKFLPGAGENQTPAPLPKETLELVKKTMEDVYKAVYAKGYARIDCFYQNAAQSSTGQERVIVLEINTLPGLTPATCIFHQAAEVGIKPMDFIDKIITLGFEEHASKKSPSLIAQDSQNIQKLF